MRVLLWNQRLTGVSLNRFFFVPAVRFGTYLHVCLYFRYIFKIVILKKFIPRELKSIFDILKLWHIKSDSSILF